MNKETLKETAEKYADFSNDYVPLAFGSKFNETTKRDFIEGAKWQQERMYSEEEVMTIFFLGRESLNKALITQEEALDIIKQFKKKLLNNKI